jgi:hypothetical protein
MCRFCLKTRLLKPKEIADSFPLSGWRFESMMGPRQVGQAALFYEFSLERHVPAGIYVCPAGKVLTSTGTLVNDGSERGDRASACA